MTLRALILLSVSTAAIACAQGAQAATNLLTNGGFDSIGAGAVPESWGGLTYYTDGTHPGNVALPGWTVEAGSVDLTATSSAWGPADRGAYSLDINGWEAGTISQTFNTVAGQSYDVTFAYTRNAAGGPDLMSADVGVFDGASLIKGVTVSTLNNPSVYGVEHGLIWHDDGFTFTASGSTSTLRLAADIPGNAGVFFDTVSVTGVPEPMTWALMIVGFGGVGAVLRSRRRAALATA
jgi:hypothetical protein